MLGFKVRFSIRSQILVLVIVSLSLGFLSFVAIGTRLIVRDKTSYIYDYTFSKVELISREIRSEVERAQDWVSFLPDSNSPQFKRAFDRLSRYPGLKSASAFSLSTSDSPPEFIGATGSLKTKNQWARLISGLAWNDGWYQREKIRLSLDSEHRRLTLGLVAGGRLYLFRLDANWIAESGRDKHRIIKVLESTGRSALSENLVSTKKSSTAQVALSNQLLPILKKERFSSGVREVDLSGKTYLMGYQRLSGTNVYILSLVSKEVAFRAAKALLHSSLALGICILLITTGAAILLLQRMSNRIRELVEATERISRGEFSKIQKTESRGLDEISILASSFDLMSGKIQDLLHQTAKNTRMEIELKTAHALQSQFFPKESLVQEGIALSGKTVFASECGGDWWQYVVMGDDILAVMGDVTGHGVSAALVTASLYTAFHLFVSALQNHILEGHPIRDPAAEVLLPLRVSFERALRSGISESATFPCLIAWIQVKSGKAMILNAGHPKPYLFRDSARKFVPVGDIHCPPIGYDTNDPIVPTEFDLLPGDWLLWHTDGIYEQSLTGQKRLKKRDFLGRLEVLLKDPLVDATFFCNSVVGTVLSHLGTSAESRPDDVTVLVIHALEAETKTSSSAA